jgi:hypothetical protein
MQDNIIHTTLRTRAIDINAENVFFVFFTFEDILEMNNVVEWKGEDVHG